MNDITIKHIDAIPAYEGEHAIPGIQFRFAAKALGVTAWGMNIGVVAPGVTAWPEHDHHGDGQEEVYFIVAGSAVLVVGDARTPLPTGTFVRVPPQVRRTLHAGPEGMTVLAIGGTPGQPYTPQFG
ncbi:MAG: cupin domain-containing protein [Deltaproteobacteria bacterium]|nr:cupin domain-containing protein [Deltaproteobacteria bacterium]MBK8234910.1 cupin domain-containing protein [Deltaproteobacteria bacterium]MBK8719770.1 cupin domain-containing protein [Deltaproteobacteria bacterium]MBP7285254.1 cupin domain-containing protein [Nannocystaceae bacterium]